MPASDHGSPVRTMFIAYSLFIVAIIAFYLCIGIADR